MLIQNKKTKVKTIILSFVRLIKISVNLLHIIHSLSIFIH